MACAAHLVRFFFECTRPLNQGGDPYGDFLRAGKWRERTLSHRRTRSDMRCEVVAFMARKTGPALATRTRAFAVDHHVCCAPTRVDWQLVVEVTAIKQATPSGAMR